MVGVAWTAGRQLGSKLSRVGIVATGGKYSREHAGPRQVRKIQVHLVGSVAWSVLQVGTNV